MNLKASGKVDIGGSVKGAANAAVEIKSDVSGNVSGAVSGAKDTANAAKDKVSGAVDSAQNAATDAANAVKEKANAAMEAAKEKAAETRALCRAAVDKFKTSAVAPANGWKGSFATAGSITIGKSFNKSTGIDLKDTNTFEETEPVGLVIELQNENGEPIKNAKYEVNANGNILTGELDSSGKAEIKGIDPGECTVRFPDLDDETWNMHEQSSLDY